MIEMKLDLDLHTVHLRNATMERIVALFDGFHDQFARAAILVHRKTVFSILIYMIRLCPVVTGRLRGSWTPFLDKYGKQTAYARYLNEKALSSGVPKSVVGRFLQKLGGLVGLTAVNEGKSQGYYADAPFITTVGTNVVYAAKVNENSAYFDRTVSMAQLLIQQNFDDFIEKALDAGWIPPLDDEPITGRSGI